MQSLNQLLTTAIDSAEKINKGQIDGIRTKKVKLDNDFVDATIVGNLSEQTKALKNDVDKKYNQLDKQTIIK